MNGRHALLFYPISRTLMGAVIAYLLGIWSGAFAALDWRIAGLVGVYFLLCALYRIGKKHSALCLVFLCVFFFGLCVCRIQLSISDEPTQPGTPISGTVIRIESDYRVMLNDVSLQEGMGTNRPVVVSLMRNDNEPAPDLPKIGQHIYGTGRLFAPDEVRNPGGTDGRIRAICDGYELSGYILPGWTASGEARFSLAEWFRQVRIRFSDRVRTLFGEHAALFMAVMLGERSDIDAEMTAAMRLTGTAHILSVSGMHLNMMSAAVVFLLSLLPIGKRLSRAIHVAVLLLFTGLTGCAVGTVRALVMTLLRLYAKARGRRYDRLTALAAAALLITIKQPLMAFDGGFQFSFFVVLGLILLVRPLSGVLPLRLLLRHAKPFGEMLVISLSAQIAAVPMQLSLYGYIPLLSLPMNLLSCLLMPMVMTGGWCVLLVGLFSEEIASVCAGALAYVSESFEALSLAAASLDLSILRLPAPCRALLPLIGCAMMLCGREIRFGKWRKAALIWTLIVSAALYLPRFDPAARYVQIDVGQGDASLIRSGRHAVVVDVGPESSYDLLRYLRHEGLFVDAVVLSHLDEDHAGALKTILSSEIDVDRIMMAEGARDNVSSIAVLQGLKVLDESGVRVEYVTAGDLAQAGDIRLIVLSPHDALKGSNERSLLLYAAVGEKTMLLTGDLPADCEPDVIPACDVLKVAHHGSRYASSEAFLSMAQPELAIISVGASNSYGHPHERVLGDLEDIGAEIYRTDQSGCITVYLDEPVNVHTMIDESDRIWRRNRRFFHAVKGDGAVQ